MTISREKNEFFLTECNLMGKENMQTAILPL